MEKQILVLGTHVYVQLFEKYGNVERYDSRTHTDISKFDIIAFTGGADINPYAYSHPVHRTTFVDHRRDREETHVAKQAFSLSIPTVGICRGGQLLSVMNGDVLVQHCDNHTRDHLVIYDGRYYKVNSSPHQMMVGERGKILAYAHDLATFREGGDGKDLILSNKDPEVIWYDQTQSLCVQFHPERVACVPAVTLFDELMKEYIL